MAQQLGDTAAGGDRAFHGEGVDDLGRGGGIFGVDARQKGQDVAKEGVRGSCGQVGVKVGQRAVVGAGLGEREADEPAHQQVGAVETQYLACSSNAGSEHVSAQARTISARTNWSIVKVGGAPGVSTG